MRRKHLPGRSTSVACLLSALLLAALVSCEDASAPEDAFSITPPSATVVVGEGVQLTALNAPGNVTWSSNNSQIATVVPETGYVIGQGSGDATISAVSGGAVVSATVTVRLPPAIALSAPTVQFDKTIGGSEPPNQTVVITNGGDGELANLSVGPVAYGQGQPTGWLQVTPGGSNAPVTVTLSVRSQGLGRGIYTATLPIAAPGIDNSPQSLAVTFRVNSPPSIVPSRPIVPMAGIPGATISESVNITNGGDVALTGLASSVVYGVGAQNWLTATLGGSSAPTTLALIANTAGIPVGNYLASVHLTSTTPGVSAVDIQVQLTVNPGPAISLSATNFNVQATSGTNAAPRTIDVANGGGGTLTGVSTGTVSYGAAQPTGWLSATTASGTAPTTITLNFSTSALAQGSYSATLPVISPVASNSPVNVSISLTVGPPPTISLSPPNITFATWGGSATIPGAQAVVVSNGGGGTLSGLAVNIAYNTGATGWLTAQFQGANTAPTIVLLRPNTTSLGAGNHTATVTISSNLPGVASKTVAVTYTIQTFIVNVYPGTQASCTGGGCHSGNNPLMNISAPALCANLKAGGYVVAGNPSGSSFYTRPRTSGHTGGLHIAFSNIVGAWINAGAPCT